MKRIIFIACMLIALGGSSQVSFSSRLNYEENITAGILTSFAPLKGGYMCVSFATGTGSFGRGSVFMSEGNGSQIDLQICGEVGVFENETNDVVWMFSVMNPSNGAFGSVIINRSEETVTLGTVDMRVKQVYGFGRNKKKLAY